MDTEVGNPALLDGVSPQELADAADANFVVHAGWALQHTPGMRAADEMGIVLTDSGLPSDTFNVVCRSRLDARQASECIQTVLAYFHQAGRPFTWWVGPGDRPADLGTLLLNAGLLHVETELAMAADLNALHTCDLTPDGLKIRRVRRFEELQDFTYTISDPEDRRFYDLTASVLLSSDAPQWFYVGYLHGQPVATAEVTLGGGVAGLYNIFTLPDYRRRGIGTAMALRPLLDARECGFRTGVLQASSEGESMYTRIGFQPFGKITEYKPRLS